MEKARKFQKSICFYFIDYTKAFDCVDHIPEAPGFTLAPPQGAMTDDTQPWPVRCQLSKESSSGPQSSHPDKGGLHCPSRKAGRATGLEWGCFTGLEACPMCGFQQRLSTMGYGGRRRLLHICPACYSPWTHKESNMTEGRTVGFFLISIFIYLAALGLSCSS